MHDIRDMERLAGGKKSAIEEIYSERRRQVDGENFDEAFDDRYTSNELLRAASAYVMTAIHGENFGARMSWPWALAWFKPTGRRRDLIKAAALIVAEIERLDRLDSQSS